MDLLCRADRLRATSTFSLGLAPLGANQGPPFCGCAQMSDDHEIQSHVTNDIDMDEAFCGRMRAAIAAGLESAPTSGSTAPCTKNPKYVSDLTAKYHRPVEGR